MGEPTKQEKMLTLVITAGVERQLIVLRSDLELLSLKQRSTYCQAHIGSPTYR